MTRKESRARKARILAMLERGDNYSAIGRIFGVSRQRVQQIAWFEASFPSKGRLNDRAITEMHSSGMVDADIAQRLGISAPQVASVRYRLCLPLNPAKRGRKPYLREVV